MDRDELRRLLYDTAEQQAVVIHGAEAVEDECIAFEFLMKVFEKNLDPVISASIAMAKLGERIDMVIVSTYMSGVLDYRRYLRDRGVDVFKIERKKSCV